MLAVAKYLSGHMVLSMFLFFFVLLGVSNADERHGCVIQVFNDSSSISQVNIISDEEEEGEVFSINPAIIQSIRQAYYHCWTFDAYINNEQIESIIYYSDNNGTIDKNLAQTVSLLWGVVCGCVFFFGIGRG